VALMSVQSVENNYAPVQQEVKIKVLPGGKSANKYDDQIKLPEQAELKVVEDNKKSLEEAVVQANKTLETYNTELQFSIHKESGEVMVKVINSSDNTVIREIPPERVLDFVANVKKMLGLILDKLI
jgi:flagellar protein FlaG